MLSKAPSAIKIRDLKLMNQPLTEKHDSKNLKPPNAHHEPLTNSEIIHSLLGQPNPNALS